MKLSLSIIATLFFTLGINATPFIFDWRSQGIMTPVRDQMGCNASYAFASVGVIESHLKWKRNINVDVSEQDIIDCSYRRFMGGQQNRGCDDGFPTAVFDYLNIKDIVQEHQYPYISSHTGRHGVCRNIQSATVLNRGLKHFHVMPRNEDDLEALILQEGPLVIAIAVNNEWKRYFDDLGDEIFDLPIAIKAQPNHFVVLTGYGVQNGKRYWAIKNSWGPRWGMGGYGKIARGKNMCNLMAGGVWYIKGL